MAIHERIEKVDRRVRWRGGHALRALVLVRFADWQPSWNCHIESVTDASQLQQWIRLAGTLDSGEAFLRAIGELSVGSRLA